MPSLCKPARVRALNTSSPVRATKDTLPPRRAAATAWLAPFPPANIKKVPPRTVSPGPGRIGLLTTMSVLVLPQTRIDGRVVRMGRVIRLKIVNFWERRGEARLRPKLFGIGAEDDLPKANH